MACRLPEREAHLTIASGRKAGENNPRTAPERNGWAVDETCANGVADEMLTAAPSPPDHDPKLESNSEEIYNTDLGNSKRFAAEHRPHVRYCGPWGRWYVWTGKRWQQDDTDRVMAMAKKTILRLTKTAAKRLAQLISDGAEDSELKKAKAFLEFTKKSQHVQRLKAMIDLARCEPGIPILPEDMDRDPMLFNTLTGTIDLRTGEQRQHNPDDYITKLCSVAFDPQAECPHWISAVSGIFANEDAMISHVHRFLGYCMSGETREHLTPIAYGTGSNGKTLFFTTIADVLGPDYAGTAPPELLLLSPGDQHPTVKADLHGKRLMIAVETPQGARLNEQRLKALTGSDRIKARRMREDFWEFTPEFKLILMTNHRPHVNGQDHGMWRRLVLWPFTARFWDLEKGETGPPELQADKKLAKKLKAERVGILAWLVRGAMEWQSHGVGTPRIVLEATREYRTTEDRLGAFIADCCTEGSGLLTLATKLYGRYKQWCDDNGERAQTAIGFGMSLADRGIERDKGRRNYVGIALIPMN
jgi:putative DNA primase/helicase